MKRDPRFFLLLLAVCAAGIFSSGRTPESTITFTVSMEQPHTHTYHIDMDCTGLDGQETVDFKMPAWTPGYYMIMDYARNVLNFRAEDGDGGALAWAKTAKNAWRVETNGSAEVHLRYDVYSFRRSVAESFLDDSRAFISPTGVFMHIDGRIAHPVTVTFRPNKRTDRISTGLDPVEGRPGTFSAPDFDILYDCPVLIGEQEILTFEVQGIPHVIAIENAGAIERPKFLGDIKRVVEAAVALIGEIPYRHYTFIMMDQGGGGLEHLNSMAVFSNLAGWDTPRSYAGWLSFIAHEYFHLYNVKRIRPIALGPFDYDRENYTTLLWVSEGITVYYQDIILNRAGLLSREDYFRKVRRFIRGYENRPGRLFQSAAEASFDTWMKFFSRSENSANTTVSYYDKGAALGLLLDLKIRHESRNRASLDDVMRALYRKYYKQERRGFTDREFREECESTAGCPLSEIFDVYVPTVSEIDYPKYFAYAGLAIDVTPEALPGAFFGASTSEQDGRLMVSSVEWGSPAMKGGLSAQDEILALNGIRTNSRSLERLIRSKQAGERLRVLLARRGRLQELEIKLGTRKERSFRISFLDSPDPLQAAILKDWLNQ